MPSNEKMYRDDPCPHSDNVTRRITPSEIESRSTRYMPASTSAVVQSGQVESSLNVPRTGQVGASFKPQGLG